MGVFRNIIAWIGSLQRKRTILAVAVLSVVTTALFAASHQGEAQSGGRARNMPNPLDILASRSPGARPAGVLLQKKKRMASLARSRPPTSPTRVQPRERVLSVGRVRPTAAPVFPGLGTPLALADVPLSFVNVPGLGGVSQGPAFEVPTIIIGDVPSSSFVPEAPVPPNPGPAVPEPATWMLMILGLGWVGLMLRRTRTVAPDAAALPVTGASDANAAGDTRERLKDATRGPDRLFPAMDHNARAPAQPVASGTGVGAAAFTTVGTVMDTSTSPGSNSSSATGSATYVSPAIGLRARRA